VVRQRRRHFSRVDASLAGMGDWWGGPACREMEMEMELLRLTSGVDFWGVGHEILLRGGAAHGGN
jgi:hypothetical protein